MDLELAIAKVRKEFPFVDYCTPLTDSYLNVGRTVSRHLKEGSRVLDFGSGPCDKAAVLQAMGYACTAWDDLSDVWHKIPGNREKIIKFAQDCGVNFVLAEGPVLPFQKNAFDMVMLHDVIEHLHDSPKDLLNDLVELIRPGGFLFITVPNAGNIRKRLALLFGGTNLPDFEYFYWFPGPWRGHAREYVRGDLRQLGQWLGLEQLELTGCDHMLHRLPPIGRQAYLSLTAFFPSFKDTWRFIARKPAEWRARRTLPESELKRVINKYGMFKH